MWPFKSKHIELPKAIINTIICIPGYWENITDIFSMSNGSIMAVGGVLMDIGGALMGVEKQVHFGFEFCERDERIRLAFEVAGSVTGVSADFLEEIDQHKSVIYINANTGNYDDIKLMAQMAAKLVDSGGIGVKVETTGKAFEKDKWISLSKVGSDADMYTLFVLDSLVNENGAVYSCGMHNLGLKDTVVSGLEVEESLRLISLFNYYQVIDKPVIKSNQTFSTEVDAPRYIILDELNQPYKGMELFENPFGMWRLSNII